MRRLKQISLPEEHVQFNPIYFIPLIWGKLKIHELWGKVPKNKIDLDKVIFELMRPWESYPVIIEITNGAIIITEMTRDEVEKLHPGKLNAKKS